MTSAHDTTPVTKGINPPKPSPRSSNGNGGETNGITTSATNGLMVHGVTPSTNGEETQVATAPYSGTTTCTEKVTLI